MSARSASSLRVGRKVRVVSNVSTLTRWVRGNEGDPSHSEPSGVDRLSEGGIDCTPSRHPSPRLLPTGITAPLPTKLRRPILFTPTWNTPRSVRRPPMIEPSAKKLSASMSINSGENAHTVEISARGPIFAPSSRSSGGR